MSATVSLQRHGDVGVIVIDNPPVNAGSLSVRSGLIEAVNELSRDASLKAGVLIGAGTTFIAGADIREFDKPLQDPQTPAVVAALEACPKPLVAAIDGAALGGGFEVALGCDARVATASAVVGLPEVHLGIIPGAGGTQRMPRLAGIPKSIELIATGKRVPAAEALKLKLIDSIAQGELQAFAMDYARKLGGKRRVRDMTVPVAAYEDVARAVDAVKGQFRKNSATKEAVEVVKLAATADIDAGLTQERAVFQRLRNSEGAAAMRHLFFAERAAGRLADREVKAREVKSVGIIGGGTMGIGIAISFLDAGYPLILIEQNADALAAAQKRLQDGYQRLVKSGRIDEARMASRLAQVTFTEDYNALANVDLVVEAVFEDVKVKTDVFAKLEAVLKPGAVLGSNTSYLDLNALAAGTKRAADVVGLHFFAPANVMRLLEVVRTKFTGPETLATALQVARKLRKLPVIAGVCEGFIGNRIYSAYRRECEILLEEGAYPEQIDAALEAFGFPMGVFSVGDLSGLDIAYRTRQRLAPTRDPRERYVPILDRLCEAGRLGRKTNAGWYAYTPDAKRGAPDPFVRQVIEQVSAEKGIARKEFQPAEIQSRVLAAMVNESLLILEDGIAERASDIDLVLVNGYGFPAERGGPLFWASRRSPEEISAALDAVAADIGHGFRRADITRLHAASKQ